MLRKSFSFFILGIFLFTSTFGFILKPKSVEAAVPAGLPVADVWGVIRDEVLQPLVASLANRLVDKLVQDTINWSNNGFSGEPGFINNWDEFLQGTKHDLIAGAFSAANVAARQATYNAQTKDNKLCLTGSGTKALYDAEKKMFESMGRTYSKTLEQYAAAYCSTSAPTKLGQDTKTQITLCEKSRATALKFIDKQNKITNGIKNGYLDGEKKACDPILQKEIPVAQRTAEYNKCIDEFPLKYVQNAGLNKDFTTFAKSTCALASKTESGAIGTIAEQNYQAFKNGEVKSSRDVARNVAAYGIKELTGNELNKLFSGKGETLTKLLSKYGSNKEEFSTKLSSAGWQGYVALSDPHNNPEGLESMVKEELSKQLTNNVQNKLQDLATDNKYLDKITCDGKRDADGNCIGREVTLTPGSLVENTLANSLLSDQQKADSLGGVLAQAALRGVGKLTTHFTQKGVSALSKKAKESFFEKSDVNSLVAAVTTGGQDYQSQYDVLGIKQDSNFSTFNEAVGSGGTLDEEARIKSLIGGPEDQTGDPNTDPQIIVDLQAKLEEAINYAKTERTYYTSIDTRIKKTQESVILLDYCNPGPDYGWKDRYSEKVKSRGIRAKKREEKRANNELGLVEIEDMSTDPRVNIPGASQMTILVKQIMDGDVLGSPEVRQRKKDLDTSFATLTKIQSDIQAQLDIVKRTLSYPDLILFKSEWTKFDTARKIRAFQTALDKGYAVIPSELNQTTEQFVSLNDVKARDAVLNMSWQLWAKNTPRTIEQTGTTYKSGKQDVRYPFYLIESQLSNETTVEQAKVREQQFTSYALKVPDLLNDCLTLKSFAFSGYSDLSRPDAINKNAGELFEYMVNRSTTRGIALGIVTGTPALSFLDSFAGRNELNPFLHLLKQPQKDAQIRDFLNSEYQKKQAGQPTYFRTNDFISPESIRNSILGFPDKTVSSVVPKQCEHPTIYQITVGEVTNYTSEIKQDYDRDELDINGSSSGGSSTTYTGTATTNTCTGPDETASVCSSSGQLYCNAGNEYACTPQTTSGGSSSFSGSYDPTESGTRKEQQTNSTSIYVDAEGSVYEVDESVSPKTVKYRTNQEVEFPTADGNIPSNAKVAIQEKCTPESTQQLPAVEAYFNELYPWDNDYGYKQWKHAKTVVDIFLQDRMVIGRGTSSRLSGILFCRNLNGIGECTRNWYTASEISYKLLFSKNN